MTFIPLAPLVPPMVQAFGLVSAPTTRRRFSRCPFTRKNFGKDAYIVREGQQVSECALLLKGFAFRQKLLRDGSRQIISFHIPSEFVDLQNSLLGVADHSVQSLNRCEVALIPRSRTARSSPTRSPAIRRWRCGSTR